MIWLFSLIVVAGMALLFGFIANYAFKRRSTARRAAYAAVGTGLLVTLPAYVALARADAEIVAYVGVAVATTLLSALAFPLAFMVTKRKPLDPDPTVFD
ncbi:MAG: hypothetical protein ACKO1O_02820 [Erythrobacter sp.]